MAEILDLDELEQATGTQKPQVPEGEEHAEAVVDPNDIVQEDTTADDSPGLIEEATAEEPQPEKVEIPDKFKGKPVEEIVKAYQELEKELGRKGNEIGELRKLTDELLRLELEQKKNLASNAEGSAQDSADEDDTGFTFDDLLENPQKIIENSPIKKEVEQLKEQLRQREIREQQALFEQKHSDWRDIAVSPEFQEWVTQSKYRVQLLQAADKYDFEAADELFSLWKEVRGLKSDSKQNGRGEDKSPAADTVEDARKKATLESSGRTSGTRKVYRRADLIRLKMTDPERYEQMADEIMLAYQEGRVR